MDELTELRKQVKQQIDKADEKTLRMMYAMLEAAEDDWWDEISDEEKTSIERGLQQLDEGNTISHEEAMQRLSKWPIK